MGKKLTFEYVKGYFEDQGCELLEEEYKNNRTKMRYRCNCGNVSEINFNNFQNNHKCNKCGSQKRSNKNKHSFKIIKQYFSNNNCALLEKKYKNNKTLMNYRCSCGNLSKISFNAFNAGERCIRCGKEKAANSKKHTIEYVKKYFQNHNCRLLEKKYIHSQIKMKYVCSCGNKSKITFGCFQQGRRCKKCGIEKISGSNNYGYNSNLTDKDREDRRTIPGYKQWVTDVYKKDNWTCKKCHTKKDNNGKYKKINAHHIEGYAKNKGLRTDTNNGITLCQKCHKQFHSIYGQKNNNKQQIDEFFSVLVLDI